MKKLLKSEVYGSVNNIWMYCSRKTWSTTVAWEKKKKKRKKKRKMQKEVNVDAQTCYPNTHLIRCGALHCSTK